MQVAYCTAAYMPDRCQDVCCECWLAGMLSLLNVLIGRLQLLPLAYLASCEGKLQLPRQLPHILRLLELLPPACCTKDSCQQRQRQQSSSMVKRLTWQWNLMSDPVIMDSSSPENAKRSAPDSCVSIAGSPAETPCSLNEQHQGT